MVPVDAVKYGIDLAAEDQDADLDLYITDEDGNILYEDERAEATASVWFTPAAHAIYNVYVKSASGASKHTLTGVFQTRLRTALLCRRGWESERDTPRRR
jgi:hypothetical protein